MSQRALRDVFNGLAIVVVVGAGTCRAATPCAATLGGLRTLMGDPTFPLEWSETTMDDARPLLLTILERDGSLFMRFVKTERGLWAEGAVAICARGAEIEAQFVKQGVRLGPAAHWSLRYTLARGTRVTMSRLDAKRLAVAAAGWHATFAVPQADKERCHDQATFAGQAGSIADTPVCAR